MYYFEYRSLQMHEVAIELMRALIDKMDSYGEGFHGWIMCIQKRFKSKKFCLGFWDSMFFFEIQCSS